MAMNFSDKITVKDSVIKNIEGTKWKIKAFDPDNQYNEDKQAVVNILPEFEYVNGKNRPIPDTIQYYQIKATAMSDSGEILEDDELVFNSKNLELFEELERKDKVKVKIAKDDITVRVTKNGQAIPTLVVSSVTGDVPSVNS
jgi:hypothetical protein